MGITPRPIGTIKNTNRLWLTGVGAVAFAVSLVVGYFTFARPIMFMLAAQQGRGAACEITHSSVIRHEEVRNTDMRRRSGPTYSPAVSYQYVVDGHQYVGDRPKFTSISTNDRSDAQEIVAKYRPGSKTACWYDPANPAASVIDRSPNGDLAFAVFPLVFFLGGLGALGYAAFGDWTSGYGGTGGVTFATPSRTATQLAPASSRGTELLVIGALTLVVNALVAALAFMSVHQWQRDHEPGAVGIVALVFGFFGLLLLIAFIAQLLTLANPRATITISAPSATLGEEFTITWALSGHRVADSRFTISLDGREVAKHTGQNNYTEENLFATFSLAEKRATDRATSGTAKFTLPADSMHTLDTPTAKIAWIVRVRGEIPKWPDTEDEFALIVSPCR